MSLRDGLLIFLAAGWIATLAALGLHHPKPDPAAPLRTEEMIRRLQGSGWVVAEATEQKNLVHALQQARDSTDWYRERAADLGRQAELAGAHVDAVAEMRAQAETALRLSGEAFVDSTLNRPPSEPQVRVDSVATPFSDGVFSGRVAFYPPRDTFFLSLRADVRAALAVTTTADRRLLFSAVPEDPRVSVSFARAEYELPPPVLRCPLGTRVRWGGMGVLAGGVAALLLGTR